jgi:rRNA maturation endonuclease Nob1
MLTKLKERMERARDIAQEAASNVLVYKVSAEVQAYRYNTCQGCEKLYKLTDTCKVCGCFMKVKTWMPNQECPLKKWPTAPAAEPDSTK